MLQSAVEEYKEPVKEEIKRLTDEATMEIEKLLEELRKNSKR